MGAVKQVCSLTAVYVCVGRTITEQLNSYGVVCRTDYLTQLSTTTEIPELLRHLEKPAAVYVDPPVFSLRCKEESEAPVTQHHIPRRPRVSPATGSRLLRRYKSNNLDGHGEMACQPGPSNNSCRSYSRTTDPIWNTEWDLEGTGGSRTSPTHCSVDKFQSSHNNFCTQVFVIFCVNLYL
jgi:hypothetical protein